MKKKDFFDPGNKDIFFMNILRESGYGYKKKQDAVTKTSTLHNPKKPIEN